MNLLFYKSIFFWFLHFRLTHLFGFIHFVEPFHTSSPDTVLTRLFFKTFSIWSSEVYLVQPLLIRLHTYLIHKFVSSIFLHAFSQYLETILTYLSLIGSLHITHHGFLIVLCPIYITYSLQL